MPTIPPMPSGTAAANARWWGDRARDWADIQEPQFRVGYERVFQKLEFPAGTAYCDIGCGAGLALQIASLRGANPSGLDAAPALLEIARRRVPRADLRQGEMENLPFPSGSFDLVTGFNSFQYAGKPRRALAEAKRVTKPGGQVVIMTWGDPQGMEAASVVTALKSILPPAPAGAPGPFALSDRAALADFAREAGLTPTEVYDVECLWHYSSLDLALRGLNSSGIAARARENSGLAAVDSAHRAALLPYRQPDGSYRIKAKLRWLLANNS